MSKKEHVYGKRWTYGNPGISVIIVRTRDVALRPELIIDANTSLVPIRLRDGRRKGTFEGRTFFSNLFLRNLFIALAMMSIGFRELLLRN